MALGEALKTAGTNTLAAIQSGVFVKAELYDLTLLSGVTVRFTDYDLPLTVGANTYLSNVVVTRGALVQKGGIQSQTLDLELSPQVDAVSPLTIAGLPFLQAVLQGYLDGAHVTMYKVFMQDVDNVVTVNTNGEAVKWFVGQVSTAVAGRQKAKITVESDLALLAVQMPRRVLQPACSHQFCDTGCTLALATYTFSGTVSATGPNGLTSFTSGLTQADSYFDLGYVKFTSGANSGLSSTIKQFTHTNGVVQLVAPLPNVPATGDTFSVVAGCDKQLTTCKTKFAADNSSHFGGFPFIPVPETLYDGGSVSAPAPTLANQGQPGSGSWISGRWPGRFKP